MADNLPEPNFPIFDTWQMCALTEKTQAWHHADTGLDSEFSLTGDWGLSLVVSCSIPAKVRAALGTDQKHIERSSTVPGPDDATGRDLLDVCSDMDDAMAELVAVADRERWAIADAIKPVVQDDLQIRLQRGLAALERHHHSNRCSGFDDDEEHDASVIAKAAGWVGSEIRNETRWVGGGVGGPREEVWIVVGGDRWGEPPGDVELRSSAAGWWAECRNMDGRVIEVLGR